MRREIGDDDDDEFQENEKEEGISGICSVANSLSPEKEESYKPQKGAPPLR